MPENWPSWSQEAGLGRNAPRTPENQRKVARFKMQQYYNTYGNWEDVAAVWYSGQPLGPNQHDPQPYNGHEYPSIRSYVDQVMSRMGGSSGRAPAPPNTGNTPTGGALSSTTTLADDETYKSLREQAQEAYDDWLEEGSPTFDEYGDPVPSYARWQALTEAVSAYEATFGPQADGQNSARDAISNWATVEGINEQRAQNAYERWRSTQQLAQDLAGTDIAEAGYKNEQAIAVQEARNQSSTPGLLPRNLVAGHVAPRHEDAVKKWKDKFGVGDTPPAGHTPSGSWEDFLPPTTGSGPAAPGAGSATRPTSSPVTDGLEDNLMASGSAGVVPLPPLGKEPFPGRSRGGSWEPKSSIARAQDALRDSRFGIRGPAGSQKGTQGIGAAHKAWWKTFKGGIPFLAGGATDFPGGPAVVGDGGEPEIIEVPGFGARIAGQNGPEQVEIPQGANIIPLSEKYQFHQIQQAARAPVDWKGNRDERMQNPAIQDEVLAAIRDAVAAQLALNPPSTPIPYGGAGDLYSNWRGLTGVPLPEQQAV
jgi:hypothetical protein